MGILDKLREGGAKTEWADYEIQNMIIYQVDDMLEEYYWEHIAPLEKQIKELGGKVPKKSDVESVCFRPNRHHEFWIEQKWHQFFNLLYDELLSSGFLISQKKNKPSLKNEKKLFSESFYRCFDGVSGLMESYKPKWQNNIRGDLELCVYFIDELIRLKIITDYKKDFMIENIFGIKDPTRKRQKFGTYSSSDFKPKRHKEIDLIIETSIKKLR